MPPTTRRDFLIGASALGVSGALAGCGNSAAPAPTATPGEPLLVPEGFDFPMVTPQPFAHGVASGDPLADRVIIWTRITEESPSAASIPVDWAVGTGFDAAGDTPVLTGVVAQGQQVTSADRDWTTKVDVTGLNAGTTYYYQFSALGSQSIVGRTRTAPATAVDELRLAVVACSSYWSSHWSGYGQIADRNDLDLVVHCGDYIYEFVDQDEQVRARNDIEDIRYVDYRDWLNLDECRRRYALFRSDANLCRAHQQHPWSIVWDNHDISVGFGNELDDSAVDSSVATTTLNDVVRAFYEWTPTRPVAADGSGAFVFVDDGSYPEPPDPRLHWRKLDYGPMLDVFCIDTQLYLPRDERPGVVADSSHLDAGDSLYSRVQYEWLTSEMLASQQAGKTWRLLVNQTWFAPADVPSFGLVGPDSPQLGISRWTDYKEERAALMDYLRGNNPASTRIHNTIVVSGDTHGNFASDLIEDNDIADTSYTSGPVAQSTRSGSFAENVNAGFQRASTGNTALTNNRARSVGVEFAPTSMGRGGADELIANANPASTVADQVAGARAIEGALINGNKNVQFIEWVDHGYGIVHLQTDLAKFECWWQDKLTPDAPGVLGQQLVAFAAEDSAPTTQPPRFQDQIDVVGLHGMAVEATNGSRSSAPAPEGDLQPR